MKTTVVKIPAPLLVDRRLTLTARLLWVFARLGTEPPTPGLLEARSGLCRHTVLRGLSQLQSAAWLSDMDRTDVVSVPAGLLLDSRVGVGGKLLYGALQLVPGFRAPAGQFRFEEFSSLAGVSINTAKQAVWTLQETGWLQVAQQNRLSPVRFTLRNPTADQAEAEVVMARLRLEEAEFKGEAIMREFLTLLVDKREYIDNARSSYLVNPLTDELLEFDRYYPPGVAFEFNGAQHYSATARYPNSAKAKRQRVRDLIKVALCLQEGIKLVVLHAGDLSLEAIRQKVEGLLPLQNLDDHEPLIAFLEEAGRTNAEAAAQIRRKWEQTCNGGGQNKNGGGA